MMGDARYDQERKLCRCGYGYFVMLTPGEVHLLAERPYVMHMPAYRTPETVEALERLPVVECVQCRTRYDRLWREVV